MEKININDIDLSHYTLDSSEGVESIRFYNDNELIKLPHKKYLKDDRGKIIEELYNLNNDNIVTPIYGITDKKGIIGYSMNYLKDYIDLEHYLSSNETSFEERKHLMIELSKIFDYFDTVNFAYHDLHSNNIMYKDNNIKLIDLDGGVFKGYVNYRIDYNVGIRAAKKRLAKYTLATINGISEYGLSSLKMLKNKRYFVNLLNSFPLDIKRLYLFALNNDFHYYYHDITQTLENITQDMYEDTNAILEKRFRLY